MPKTQLKLVSMLAGLVALVSVISGVLVERGLEGKERTRLIESLSGQARLVREMAQGIPFVPGRRDVLDRIADRSSAAIGARVTLIDREGGVLGDSDVPTARLSSIENHKTRPEVARALAGEIGVATRRSNTVGRELYYVALPPEGERGGVVRLAMEVPVLEKSVASMRRQLVMAGLLGLLAAIVLGFFLTGITLSPLVEIRRVVASISRGDLDDRLNLPMGTELGEIASSINELAAQLGARLRDATGEKERLLTVLSAMVEGVLVLDLDGRVLLANPRLREFFGLEDASVEGLSPVELLRSPEFEVLLHQVGQTREARSGELHVVGVGDDRTLRVQSVGFPTEGDRAGTVAVFHDVTELERLEQIRGDFVANASHELRTPLTAICGFAETLLRDDLSGQEQRQFVEIIDRHAKRLSNLVNDLLELSKIEGRKLELQCVELDLGEFARSVMRDHATRFEEKRIDVSFKSAGKVTAWVDRQVMEQILINLIDNAAKYTDEGGTVFVEVEERAGGVTICIRDTGVGIPEKDLDRIFERFYRVEKARSRAQGGTGLGLAIVKHLSQSIGGEVSVESKLGEGSAFTLQLPHRRKNES